MTREEWFQLQVGDTLLCIDQCDQGGVDYFPGDTAVVSSTRKEDDVYWVRLDGASSGSMYFEKFEKIDQGITPETYEIL